VGILSSYNFVSDHLEARKNSADRSLRKPLYEIGHEKMTARHLATLVATTITESYGNFLSEIKAAKETDYIGMKIRPT